MYQLCYRFDPNKQELDPQRSKAQIKKDAMVEMLAPDLIESDPLVCTYYICVLIMKEYEQDFRVYYQSEIWISVFLL